jgi:glycosyltransferase involved in cell wall biosynthesis
MKILYYSPHPHLKLNAPTGYGTHMREMIGAWRSQGVEVKTFIAGDLGGEEYGESKPSRFAFLKKYIPSKLWETIKDYQLIRFDKSLETSLIELVNEFEPDLIYERVAYLQNSGVKIASRKGVKHVAEINAPYPEERVYFSGSSFFEDQAKDHEREILVKSDLVTVVSNDLKIHLEKKLADVDSKIMVIPNSVNPKEIPESFEAATEIKQAFEISTDCVIGFVGSIFPYHGVELMIEALARIDRADVKLLIVGDGAALTELKTLAKKLNILDRCIFTGSVPHRKVYDYIQCMDICCMPDSNWYGSPVKIFEYGLMKKPVIAPNVGPVRDTMIHNQTGILVEPDAESLETAFAKLLNDRELRERIAENWHQEVLANYTWEVASKKILKACM